MQTFFINKVLHLDREDQKKNLKKIDFELETLRIVLKITSVMDFLMIAIKAFATYICIGILFWALFKKEIRIRKSISMYNILMQTQNRYHYLYTKGGRTVSVFLAIYIPFYILSLRKMYKRLTEDNKKEFFIKESEEFILSNEDSPYLQTVNKQQQ